MNPTENLYRAIKDGHIPFTGAHDIHTPRELVEDILGRIQLDGTVLVLFNIEFVISLVYTYKVDPEKITFYTDHGNKNKICDRLGVKYITSLEEDMKFDVVLLNPPYQDGKNKMFYRQFVSIAFDVAKDSVGVVVPASWNSGGMTDFKKTVIKNGLKEYSYLGGRVFKGSQNDVCYFLCKKGYVGDVLVRNKDGEIIVSNISEHGIMPHKNLEAANLLIKLSKFTGVDSQYQRGVVNPEKSAKGQNKFVLRNGSSNHPFEELEISDNPSIGFDQHKVVIAYNSSIGNIGPAKYAGKEYSIGYAVVCFPFETKEKCDNFIEYLNSKLVKFVIKNLKTSIQNSKNIFEKVPSLDMNRRWTDQDLYTHFNLTDEEIAYIEANS